MKIIIIALLALLITTLTAKTVMTRIEGKVSDNLAESTTEEIIEDETDAVPSAEYVRGTLYLYVYVANSDVSSYTLLQSETSSSSSDTYTVNLLETFDVSDGYSTTFAVEVTSSAYDPLFDEMGVATAVWELDSNDYVLLFIGGDEDAWAVYAGTEQDTTAYQLTATSAESSSVIFTVYLDCGELVPNLYYIGFDGNDADEGEMENIEAIYDEEYTLTANAFTRAGYTFTGWNTETDGSGTSYEDGYTVSNLTTTDGDTVTLYAQWEPITYTIAFDGNGADEGEMERIEATYDEEYILTTNAFTRDGYTFTGWNTEADGSGTSYEDGATISNLTTTDGDTVTLYAQWEEYEYIITVTEYTGDTLEAECSYEYGTIILYVVDANSWEQLYVATGDTFSLSEILAGLSQEWRTMAPEALFLSFEAQHTSGSNAKPRSTVAAVSETATPHWYNLTNSSLVTANELAVSYQNRLFRHPR